MGLQEVYKNLTLERVVVQEILVVTHLQIYTAVVGTLTRQRRGLVA